MLTQLARLLSGGVIGGGSVLQWGPLGCGLAYEVDGSSREDAAQREFYWQGSPSWILAESFCRQALLQLSCNCKVCAGGESCSVSACPVG